METNLVSDLQNSVDATKKALDSIGVFNLELQKTVDNNSPEFIKYQKEVSDVLGKLNGENILSKLDSAMAGLKNLSYGA